MNLVDGGQVVSRAGNIGRVESVSGRVEVHGSNSSWVLSESLFVGGDADNAGGLGQLTVTSGGSVHVGEQLRLWGSGTLFGDGLVAGDVQSAGVIMPGGADEMVASLTEAFARIAAELRSSGKSKTYSCCS